MGNGPTFTNMAYSSLVSARGYKDMSVDQLLASTDIKPTMNPAEMKLSPSGAKIRESRDSTAHPETLAIMLFLDETGSMGYIPAYIVKEGMGHIIPDIVAAGVEHPQVFFGAIGDHYSDRAFLQVGQFECETELLDECLRSVFLEKKGGGHFCPRMGFKA